MVRITELQFAYRGQKNPLFTGLNLDLEPGNIYGLLGRNGAGKTSLLKMVTGLLFPELGELQVLGHQPGKRHPAFLQEIYFVAEESSLPAISIASFQKQQAPFYPRFSEAAFVKYLDTFDLTASTPLQQLSYGQKKKAQLAFAMATNAKDAAALDRETRSIKRNDIGKAFVKINEFQQALVPPDAAY